MGNSYPRYTTFKGDDLGDALRRLGAPEGTTVTTGPGRSGLIKSHTCPVFFPDGTEGICRYTRCAPAWHLFKFEQTGPGGQALALPVQHESRRLAGDTRAIEETAKRLAEAAFAEAVTRERKEYFQRAATPPGRKGSGGRPQMKADRAKEIAGRYALCRPVGETLLPVSPTFETMEAANAAWQEQDERTLVVACLCRWKRRWERPQFNPLHAHPDYNPMTPQNTGSSRIVDAGADGDEAELDSHGDFDSGEGDDGDA